MQQASQYRAGFFKQSIEARNGVRIGLSYRPASLHRLAKLIPGLLKRFKIRVLYTTPMNETPSRRITVMSSLNEISTDQNRVVDGGEGVSYSATLSMIHDP